MALLKLYDPTNLPRELTNFIICKILFIYFHQEKSSLTPHLEVDISQH